MSADRGLARAVRVLGAPRLELGAFPTPVERVPSLGRRGCELWVKRDDISAAPYGGSKVRKLEYLLADARQRGKKKILTMGAIGSHHVLATTVFGRREGFDVSAILLPQPSTPHVVMTARADLVQGLHPIAASFVTLPVRTWLATDDDTYVITLGGSSPLGSLGYVAAALELAAQIDRGDLPAPDRIYVALGSGGTAAGLAVGLELAGLGTRVVGIAVGKPVFILRLAARRLVRKVARACGVDQDRALGHLEVDGRWVGGGYGRATPLATTAIERASEAGLLLDTTYTGKAFAAALAHVEEADPARRVLFWHTLSSRPLEPLLTAGDVELPASLERLLR